MRTKIISGIIGVVACVGVAIAPAAPSSAASATPSVLPPAAAEVLDAAQVPRPCIDCW